MNPLYLCYKKDLSDNTISCHSSGYRKNVHAYYEKACINECARWQESAWVGGKKNDVVIMWGGDNIKPDWCVVFGWTDSKTVLRELETIILDNGAKTDTLPLIADTIKKSYKLKDWDNSFKHISIPARPIYFVWYIIIMIISQILLWIFFHRNEFSRHS